jgi:hypothetical protein
MDSALAITFTDVAAVRGNTGGIEAATLSEWVSRYDRFRRQYFHGARNMLRKGLGESEAMRAGRKATKSESEDYHGHISLLPTTTEIFLVSSEHKTADYSS